MPAYKGEALISLEALGELQGVINCEKKTVTCGEGKEETTLEAESTEWGEEKLAHAAKIEVDVHLDEKGEIVRKEEVFVNVEIPVAWDPEAIDELIEIRSEEILVLEKEYEKS